MEELVATITEENEKKLNTHMQKMEGLNKSAADMLTEIKKLLENKHTGATTEAKSGRAKLQAEYLKKFVVAMACPNCGNKNLGIPDDKCWELDSNMAACPAGWKSVKST